MKRFLLVTLLIAMHMFAIHNTYAQSNARVSFIYDSNGNRTDLVVVIMRVDENAIMNDSIGDGDITEQYTDNGLDTISGIIVSIYPNPTFGHIVVSADLYEDSYPIRISLLSFDGTLLDEKTLSSSKTEFDFTGFSAGVYFLIVNSQEEKHVWKIIKNN